MVGADDPGKIVAAFKSAAASLAIPVVAHDRQEGSVRVVTGRMAKEDQLAALIFRWRGSAMHSFLTVFEPTIAKTREYLDNIYVPSPQRILFLISDAHDQPVGVAGYAGIERDSAEVDLVLRGEPAQPGLMFHALATIVAWGFEELTLPKICLNVLKGNDRAIRLYARLGFHTVREVGLRRDPTADGYRLVPDAAGIDATLLTMEISRADFRGKA
jgi:RimJ/RimL family protein N-acetyltransferase